MFIGSFVVFIHEAWRKSAWNSHCSHGLVLKDRSMSGDLCNGWYFTDWFINKFRMMACTSGTWCNFPGVFIFFFLTTSPGKMKTVAYFVCIKKLVLRWYIMQIRWRKIGSSKNRMGDQYWEFRPIWISCVSITASWYMTHMFHELMLKVLTHPSEISPVACNKGQVEGKTRVQITVDIRTY